MLSITHLKTGTKITMEGQPYEVLSYQHSKQGRGGAVVRTKLRNLMTGATLDKTFQGSDKIDEASLSHKDASYLYRDADDFLFMDDTSFEQFTIKETQIGDQAHYLVEGTKTTILYYDDLPINIELPIKMDFKVTDAPPGVKGNTASGATKSVKIETGISVSVPLFIKTGDRIRLDTRTGQYIERAS